MSGATRVCPKPSRDKTTDQEENASDTTEASPAPTEEETENQEEDASDAVPEEDTGASLSKRTPAQADNPSNGAKTKTSMASIESLTAARVDSKTVRIAGKVSSKNPRASSSVAWSLLYWDGANWKQVKNGSLSLQRASNSKKPGIDLNLSGADLFNTNLASELKFRLVVTPSQQGFLETKLDTLTKRNPGLRR